MDRDMNKVGRSIAGHLNKEFPTILAQRRQAVCLIEEVGELAGACRRYAGWARRAGTIEEVRGELADVVITAYVTMATFGTSLDVNLEPRHPRHPDLIAPASWDAYLASASRALADFQVTFDRFQSTDGANSTTGLGLYLGNLVVRCYWLALSLDVDLNEAIGQKLSVIYERGWKDPR